MTMAPDPMPAPSRREHVDAALAARVAREADYHEGVFEENARLQGRFGHVFACPNAQWAEAEHLAAIRAAVPGRRVLDYGCADGESSQQLLSHGAAQVCGIDISESAISRARQRNLSQATFEVGDAHRLPWPDASFDVVVGRAILHHLNLPLATAELVRVLRPGGQLFFVEPLYHNPLAALFRVLTPKARTLDEKPLTRAEVLRMESAFEGSEHRYALLVSMAVGAFTSLLPGVGPSNPLLRAADRIDRALARTPLRWWMGQIYLHLRSPRTATPDLPEPAITPSGEGAPADPAPAAPEGGEVLPADPRFRRQAAILLAVLAVVGAVIVVLFDRWVMDVRQMPPRQAAGRLLAGYLAWTVACSAALLVLAAVLWRTGVQAITTARFPTAGTRVLRDTPVLVGDEAVRRGKALKVLAGVLCGCVVAVAVMAWLLTRRLAT